MLKAVAQDPALRFETAEEMMLALEVGERKPLLPPPRTPLAGRDLLTIWKLVATVSLLVNVLMLYLLVI